MSGTIEPHFEGLWYKYMAAAVFGFKTNIFTAFAEPYFSTLDLYFS